MTAGLLEWDRTGLKKPDQRSSRGPQQVRRFLSGQHQVMRSDRHGQAGLHSCCNLEEHFEHRLWKLDAAPIRTCQSRARIGGLPASDPEGAEEINDLGSVLPRQVRLVPQRVVPCRRRHDPSSKPIRSYRSF